MKRILPLIIISLLFSSAFAQQVSISSFVRDNNNTKVEKRLDNNGEECAVIKVKSPLKCSFNGNIIGDVVRKTDGYHVYVTAKNPNTRSLAIIPDGGLSTVVNFADFGIDNILPGALYILEINQGTANLASYLDLSKSENIGSIKNADDFSVDLGLSVRWATMNVGASKPEDKGSLFSWGEVKPKDVHAFDGSPAAKMNSQQLRMSGITTVGNKLAPAYDAATANWGVGWRMPTISEKDELRLQCVWEFVNLNGSDGFKITGPNGNSIFLPCSYVVKNLWSDKLELNDYQEKPDVDYWTGQPSLADYCDEDDKIHNAATLHVYAEDYGYKEKSSVYPNGDNNRGGAMPVRAVVVNSDEFVTYNDNKSIRHLKLINNDLSALTHKRQSKNGQASPLIKVNIAEDCSFKGPIVGDVRKNGSQYWVYTDNGAESLTVSSKSGNSWIIRFSDFNITLKPGLTYDLTISSNSDSVSNANVVSVKDNAVDLGLSVLWASHNVGANTPEETGCHFAWGEVEPKKSCTESNSKTYMKDAEWLEVNGYVDINGRLKPKYDAATHNWGNDWRMPSKDEVKELLELCRWQQSSLNGVNGFQVIGPNGNSIFLPVTGEQDGDGFSVYKQNYSMVVNDLSQVTTGNYSTCEFCNDDPERDCTLFFNMNDGFKGPRDFMRYLGKAVRPVSKNATNKDSAPLSRSNASINDHEYVDLGLPSGLKWATCNVGASRPEDYGDYFAWGETSPRLIFDRENSTWGRSKSWLHSNGYIDSSGNLAPTHDAARRNWGATWRMPTKTEIEELIANTTTEWTTQNGVKGRLVKSKRNGNSIFLPAAGMSHGKSVNYTGSFGFYKSSTPSESDTRSANGYCFRSDSFISYGMFRDSGNPVRPVSE